MSVSATAPARAEPPAYEYMTPEELLEAFRVGDDEAFAALVEQIGGRLYGFICRLSADAHLAEDVYQQVLIKIALKAGDYDGRARLLTWVYAIARNAVIDTLRQLNRKPEYGGVTLDSVDGKSPVSVALTRDLSPLDQLTVRELGERIRLAVEALPLEQREVFLLREDGDLSFIEIAQILGCGKDTAKSRMRYALLHLRQALGAEARLYGLMAGL